ncbi:MAG: DNRLRE domain-containing protein [Phycisphaeraceae bacterium]|nr:MAG: DNRLRE domain-containing protein [Phycisphaeraceae bacterium]
MLRFPRLESALMLLVLCAAASAQSGLTPLNDLGAGQYLGFEGGLYAGGVNEPPAGHLAEAMARSTQIIPRDATGAPDPDGLIGLIAIGMSNTAQEFAVFERQEDLNTGRNARIVIVGAAQGGQPADVINDPGAMYWGLVQNRIHAAGLTPEQVQVIWLKQAQTQPLPTFPEHAESLRDDLRDIVHILHDTFPNLQICYLSSRIYAGYTDNPFRNEPLSYQTGFAVKWLINDQIDGDPELNFDADKGVVRAPLLLWGPYLWADGPEPRSDGLTWLPEDYESDNIHPSPSGEQKVADLLSDSFASDPTAHVWWRPRADVRLVAIDAEADAHVRSDMPNTNSGSGPEVVTFTMENGVQARGFVRFVLDDLVAPVRYAKLNFRSAGGSIPASVQFVPDSTWDELGITYSNAPGVAGLLGALPPASRDIPVSLDLTSTINAQAPAPVSIELGVAMVGHRRFFSRESGQPPRLVITVRSPCPADLDGDGVVGSSDLAILLGAWGDWGGPFDVDGSGLVGSGDLAALLGAWGPCPQ